MTSAIVLCLLGLTISLAQGQTLSGRIAPSNSTAAWDDSTKRVYSFFDIGPGGSSDGPRPLACFTTNTATIVWQFPNGTEIDTGPAGGASGSQLFTRASNKFVSLHRGPDYLSPEGQYCCVRTTTNASRCITLTFCPSLRLLGLGLVEYDPDTNIASTNCDEGVAVVKRDIQLVCNEDSMQWSAEQPYCLRICPDLKRADGMISYDPNTTHKFFDNVATHSCDPGYEITSGETTRTCQIALDIRPGVWSGEPITCQLICPDLSLPANGAVVYSDTTIPRDEGSTATYSCNSGYVLTGNAVRTCTSSGWSGSDPVCTATCVDLPVPNNGMINYSPNTIPRLEGTVATYLCVDGYKTSAGTERTCQSDRTWSGGTVDCIARCSLLALLNGTVTYSPSDFPILEGTVATHSCDSGFIVTGDALRICLSTNEGREWNGTEVTCRATCDDLASIPNGLITYSPNVSPRLAGSTADYTCVMGLMLIGEETRTCQNDHTWSGSEPHCQRVFLQLGKNSIASANSELLIIEVGQGSRGLVCRTDHPQCCNSTTNASWVGPNNTVIPANPGVADFYVDYGLGFVKLNSRSNTTTASGNYCCIVPVAGGGMESFCVQLTLPGPVSTEVGTNNFSLVYTIAIDGSCVIATTSICHSNCSAGDLTHCKRKTTQGSQRSKHVRSTLL